MDKRMTLFLCDPTKHKKCRKTGCLYRGGECFLTTYEGYKVQESGPVIFDENGDIKAVEYDEIRP